MNLGIYCALAGIVGAKLFMIVLDPYYRKNPAQIFTLSTLQSAGIWYGGFIVALVFAFFYMRQPGPALSQDLRHLRARSRHRPRDRTAGLLRRRLLLWQADASCPGQ